jgi:hypothetical protein
LSILRLLGEIARTLSTSILRADVEPRSLIGGRS